jgi:hydrogenase expression/formation protein HypE
MVGKVPPEELERVFDRLGAASQSVIQGPAYGEDAAGLRIGEQTLVVSTDPISLAAERVGTLGVHVACNDVAVSGADPAWLFVTILVPSDEPAVLETVTEQLDAAGRASDVSIVGGHSEYNDELSRPMLSLTCLGLADRFVPTGGAEPGDSVVLTKAAGIEGTAILATDFAAETDVAGDLVDEAVGYFGDISVSPDARAVREYATAMHDPTEGGLVDGLLELAGAADVDLRVESDAVPVREPTRALCDAMAVDPFRIFGSGALLATVPAGMLEPALADLAATGVEASVVGTVEEGSGRLHLDDETFREPVRDDLYALWT